VRILGHFFSKKTFICFTTPFFYQILATRKPKKHKLFEKINTNWLNLVKSPELLAVKKKTAKKKDKKRELEQGNVIKGSEAGQSVFLVNSAM
jgi:hypothetical protein